MDELSQVPENCEGLNDYLSSPQCLLPPHSYYVKEKHLIYFFEDSVIWNIHRCVVYLLLLSHRAKSILNDIEEHILTVFSSSPKEL